MVNINIVFDRLDRRYSPGDVVNLEVHVHVNSNTKFNSIYVIFRGLAHVDWMDTRRIYRDGKSTEDVTECYRANETFFDIHQTLAGGKNMYFSPGNNVYRTSYQLPLCLPESHLAEIGYIRYEVKADIDVPWSFAKKQKAQFFVYPHLDLNEFQYLRHPVRDPAYETYGFCCWKQKPLYVFNVLPRGGFVPGERVRFTLELSNQSEVSIYRATVKLIERIVYRGTCDYSRHYTDRHHTYTDTFPHSRTRGEERKLWQCEFNTSSTLVAGMQDKVCSIDLYFDPAWNFHCFNGTSIMTVQYYFKSEACIRGLHSNLTHITCITMGTIPFRN